MVGVGRDGTLSAAIDLRCSRWLTTSVRHDEIQLIDGFGARPPWSVSGAFYDDRVTSFNATVLAAPVGLSFTARGMRTEGRDGVAYGSLFAASYARGPVVATARVRWDHGPINHLKVFDASASVRAPESVPLAWLLGGVAMRLAVTGSLGVMADVHMVWEIRRTVSLGPARLQASILGGPHRPLTVHTTLSLMLDAAEFRTTMRAQTGATTVGVELRGGVFLDPMMATFAFDRFQRMASSGIAVRCFIDENSNDVHDPGEEVMYDVGVWCPAGRRRPLPSGYVMISDLQPDSEYIIELDSSSVGSELLTLSARRISVVTEANVITSVDVPIHRTAVIAGSVPPGISGVEIVQEDGRKRATRVFADGTFALHGVRLGRYEVRAVGCGIRSVDVTEAVQYEVAPCGSAR
jgi:hypothetical protein